MNYAQKVHDDSLKHDLDPSKRSPQKRNRSIMGFSRALNKLESRPHKEEAQCPVCKKDPCECEDSHGFVKEDSINELSSQTLQSYKDKAKVSADELTAQGKHKKAADRWLGHMKATGKQIEKTTANIKKALNREELSDPTRNAKQNKDIATGKKPMPKRKLLGFKKQAC
jgi:hypothetical protein